MNRPGHACNCCFIVLANLALIGVAGCSGSGSAADAAADAAAPLDAAANVDALAPLDMTPALFSLEGRAWVLSTVDVVADVQQYPSPIYPAITLGPDGLPAAVYTKATASSAFPAVSRFNGTSWSAPDVVEQQEGKSLGKRPSINIDATDTMHLLYYNESDEKASYAVKSPGGAWDCQNVYDPQFDSGDQSVLVRDAQGLLHATFLKYGTYNFVYGVEQPGAGWQFSLLTDGAQPVHAYSATLGVDPAGVVHIPYFDSTAMRHAYGAPGAWQHELIDDPQGAGTFHYPIVAIDQSGEPHVIYLRWYDRDADVRVARRTDSGWVVDMVDGTLGTSYTTGIAVLSCGTEVIVYARNNGTGPAGLRFAYRNPGKTWMLSSIDSQALASGIDLVAGSDGTLHVIYLDEGTFELRYARLAVP